MIAGVANWVPCNLVHADDYSPVEAVAYDDAGLSVKYRVNGGVVQTKTLALADWSEGAAGGYSIQFSAEECGTLGVLDYWVEYTGCVPYYGSMNVTAPVGVPGDTMSSLLNSMAGVIAIRLGGL